MMEMLKSRTDTDASENATVFGIVIVGVIWRRTWACDYTCMMLTMVTSVSYQSANPTLRSAFVQGCRFDSA